jgi:tetratricopeptide (TPR) repeat protein
MPESVIELTQAVRDAGAVFGASSRMVGFYSLPLSNAQAETGRIDDAIASARAGVDVITRHTRPESFRFAAAIRQRGVALLAAGRAAEALPDLASAAGTLQRTFPAGHAVTCWFQADVVLALARAGRPREALDLASTLMPAPGPLSARSTLRVLYATGVARRLAGDASGAFQAQDRVLRSIGSEPGVDGDRMRALTESGLALLDLERPGEAAAALREALALSLRLQVVGAPERAEIVSALARAGLAGDARGSSGQHPHP